MDDCRCNCPVLGGGICPRHGVYKNAQWVRLCTSKPAYFQAWEQGRGPGQGLPGVDAPRKPSAKGRRHYRKGETVVGVGSELKRLLKMGGIIPEGPCKCGQRANLMDQEGPDWCERNIEKITDWLQEEARKRHLPFLRIGAKALIKLAIYRTRKKLKALR